MNIKHIIAVFFSIVLLFSVSCKEEKKDTEKHTQMEQVIAIHDEVMPKMGKIGRLVGKLKGKVDTTAIGMEYGKAMKDLQDANASMMNWMQDFGGRFDSGEIMDGDELTPEKQEWLNEEEEKVKMVKEKINSSIAKAEALISDQ